MLKSISHKAVTFAFVLASIAILNLAHAEGSDSKTKDVQGTVIGKIVIKSERDGGNLVKVAYVKVVRAQDATGMPMDSLRGATLKVVGSQSGRVAKMSGEDVLIGGKIRGGKEIAADTVTSKRTSGGRSKITTAGKNKSGRAAEGSDSK